MSVKRPIILGSASPRRHEILLNAGIAHTIVTAEADEKSIRFTPGHAGEYVLFIAALKNAAVVESIKDRDNESLVISADTIVYFPDNDVVLGKPKDPDDATKMLRMLSGKSHEVLTGVVIHDMKTGCEERFYEATKVFFRELSEEEISEYVSSGDPLDKAGSYGMQSGACAFVRRIDGDYFNVVGLPVCRVSEIIQRFGI